MWFTISSVMISSKIPSRLQLWTMSSTPGFPSNKYLLMGWGGSVDVQHSLLYISEPFLAFLALFGLGQGHFFVAEGPAVSGSGCGGFLRFSFISDKNSSSYDTSVASIISLKSESLKSKSLSSVSDVNSFMSWSFCRGFVCMPCFDAILEMKNSNDYIIKKLDLTQLFWAGIFWRDGIEPKLILESETNVIEFLQILLNVA